MANIFDPRQSVIDEIRRALTTMEFELMEPEPCAERLEVNGQRIAMLLFANFAQEDKAR